MGSRWHSLSTTSSVPPLLGVSWKTFPLFYKRGPIWPHHFVTFYVQFYSSYFTLLLFFVLRCCSSPCFAAPFHVSLLLLPMLQCSSPCFIALLCVLLLLFMFRCDVLPHASMFLSVPCCSFLCFVVPFCVSLRSSSPCFDVILCVLLLLFLFCCSFLCFITLLLSMLCCSLCFVVPPASLIFIVLCCFFMLHCFSYFIATHRVLLCYSYFIIPPLALLLLVVFYYFSYFVISLCFDALIASCFATPPCFIVLLLSQVPFYPLLFRYSSVLDYSLA